MRQLFKHKMWDGAGDSPYVSPYLLEILSTRPGAPAWLSATGSLVANTGQVVSCSRASSAYCLGDDGLLHLLGANTVRVEPTGLLVEGTSTNYCLSSNAIGDANWNTFGGAPTITLNTTDVTDPTGANHATKLAYPAVSSGQGWCYQLTGLPAGVGTQSFWLRTASGSGTIYLIGRAAAGVVQACNVDTTWRRFQLTQTSGGGVNPAYIVLGYGDEGGTIGYTGVPLTVYAWGGQVEPQAFASSNITTTSVAATRAAESVSVANPLYGMGATDAWRVGARTQFFGNWQTDYPGTFGNLPMVAGSRFWGASDSWYFGTNFGAGRWGALLMADSGGNFSGGFSTNYPPADLNFNSSQVIVTPGMHITYSPGTVGESITGGPVDQDLNPNVIVGNFGGGSGLNAYFAHFTDVFVSSP